MSTPLTPADGPIIVRKRKWLQSTDTSADAISALNKLKQRRDVSPNTVSQIDELIRSHEELCESSMDTGEHSAQKRRIQSLEDVLDLYLEKDDKHKGALKDFRKLLGKQLMLRYGHYYNRNLAHMKKVLAEAVSKKTPPFETNFLLNKPWKTFIAELDAEAHALAFWTIKAAKDKELGLPIDPKPVLTSTNLLSELATLCMWSYDHALFEMREYQRKNGVAHSGLIEVTGKWDYKEMAGYIVRDRNHIEKGLLVDGVLENKAHILEAISIYEKRFFKRIETSDSGVHVLHYELSESEVERVKEQEERRKLDLCISELGRSVWEALEEECTDDYERELRCELEIARAEQQSQTEQFRAARQQFRAASKMMGNAQRMMEGGRKEVEDKFVKLYRRRKYLKCEEQAAIRERE